ERILITTALACAEWRVNPLAAVRRLAPLRGALTDGTLAGRDLVTFIRYLLWQGKLDDATVKLGALLESLTEADPRLAAGLGLAYHFVHGADDPWTGASEEVVENAVQVLDGYELGDSTLELLAMALTVLIYADELDRAVAHCDRLLADARRRQA